ECGSRTFLPATQSQKDRLDPGGTQQSSSGRGHRRRRQQKRTASDGTRRDVLHDVEAGLRRRQRRTLAFPRHVFLFADRPRNLGIQSAGLARPCDERRPRTPDYVRHRRATLVRRNRKSLSQAAQQQTSSKSQKNKENRSMKRNQTHKMFLVAFTFAAALIAAGPAASQDPKQPYPMAPVEQYLMARDAEIASARSAAPDAISRDAS